MIPREFAPASHPWLSRPSVAAAASLVAVLFFTLLLGLVFLPKEARRLSPPQQVSVTHFLPPQAGRPGVTLFWSIPEWGEPGWRHHLAIDRPGATPGVWRMDDPCGQPISITSGADASHVFVGNWDGAIYSFTVREPSRPAEFIGRQPDGGVVALACSPDGKHLLSQNAFHLYGWNLITRTQQWRRSDIHATCFVLRPDAATAIVGNLAGDLVEVNLADGRTLRVLASLPTTIYATALSPDGSLLAVLLADGHLRLFNSHSLTPLWDLKTGWHTAAGRFIAFSPGGDMLVTTDPEDSRVLAVWNVATRTRLQRLSAHQKVILGAAFAADGTLRSWGADGTVRTWDLAAGAVTGVAALAPPLPASI